MGLDWMLNKIKPRPGSETRFAEIVAQLEAMHEDGAGSPELEGELEGLGVTVGEVLGAPRIGHDERADEWFRKEVYEGHRERIASMPPEHLDEEYAAHWSRPLEELLKENEGKYVLELAEERGGEARVSGMLASSVDFRGKIVARCPLISRELQERAYEDQSPEQMLEYARELEEEIEGRDFRGEEAEWASALRDGIAWLRFWGERGFGFWAWY
jgi:hypothetical protein